MSNVPRPDLPHVIVVGGGTAGLASAWQIAERGASVTVLDPRVPPHDEGSHGGFTRVTRHAYHEGTSYVPLVREADALWCSLEDEAGDLLVRTGMIEFGPPDEPEFIGVLEACNAFEIEHRLLGGAELRETYPFVVPDHWRGCWTPCAGYLRVPGCLSAMRSRAEALGVRVCSGARAVAIEPGRVVLEDSVLAADAIVLAAGARTPALLPDPGVHLSPLRRVMFWLRPTVVPTGLPVWGALTAGGFFYGFPPGDEGLSGLKVACHTSAAIPGLDDPVDPDDLERRVRPEDWAPVEEFLQAFMPSVGVDRVEHRVCMYGATASRDFLVDRHPSIPGLVVASGLSGHGFKFAPAIGRLVADLVLSDAEPQPEFAWAKHG
ncbi:MAG: N-methyl-L-tryptophan oxidase [Nannocystales bacterium]